MKVLEFITFYKEKKVQNTQINPHAVEDFLKKELEIKDYIPFATKQQIAEMVIDNNSTEKNGIVKIDGVGQFISFIIAMLVAHTNLEIDQTNPVADYDALSEAGLLEAIISQFQKSYSESEIVLKLVAADALADNNLNAVVARFLDGILDKLDGVSDVFKNMIEGIDLKSILGENFTEDNLSQLKGFLDKYTN